MTTDNAIISEMMMGALESSKNIKEAINGLQRLVRCRKRNEASKKLREISTSVEELKKTLKNIEIQYGIDNGPILDEMLITEEKLGILKCLI